jgi:hypothetical protein
MPIDILAGPLYLTLDGTTVDARCVHPYDNVQSAHTPSEHLVYTTMWKMLGSREDDGPSREGVLSLTELARKISVSRRNIQRILQSLEQKLALEVTGYEDAAHATPRRYRVWGFRSTMDRRRRAGYCHIYRNRNFITLARLQEQSLPPDNLSTPLDSFAVKPLDNLSTEAPDKLARGSLDKLSIPLRNISNIQKTTTTTVRSLLQERLPAFDDAAVEQLWTECVRQVPDVEPDEVRLLFDSKLPLSQSRGIENPIGFLVRAVARSCTPAAIGAIRQGREAPPELELSFDSEELQELLSDKNITPALRELIHHKLEAKKG